MGFLGEIMNELEYIMVYAPESDDEDWCFEGNDCDGETAHVVTSGEDYSDWSKDNIIKMLTELNPCAEIVHS